MPEQGNQSTAERFGRAKSLHDHSDIELYRLMRVQEENNNKLFESRELLSFHELG